MPWHPLFLVVCAAWLACELWIDRRRSIPGARRSDSGTLRLLHLALPAGMGVAGLLSLAGVWPWPPALAASALWTGLGLMAAGIALRVWAVRVLAEHFTVDVSIRPGHQLVRHGPYRLLRHPAYSGLLLSLLGYAVALGDLAALPAVALPAAFAFARRIRVEERVLREAFPDAYPRYARDTWRLLPWLW
ncbi:methyltransferase family protein [Luteimonas sp. SDU101]|uniref:methyltransferase family protein n=1 Tax=Luteimonas sp. SDU101 TaxID=3422593 RepID=UPI003EBBA8F8